MKLLSALSIAMLAVGSLFAIQGRYSLTPFAVNQSQKQQQTVSDFEKAVEIIKKYETIHQPRHWPFVGYGHKVLPGEKFSRKKALSEAEADALLRKDLLLNCARFRSFGADSLLLGVLAYNIGSGATLRSSVAKKLKEGNRDIYESYVAHSRYRGKVHSGIRQRRIEEFEALFIKDPSKQQFSPLPLSAPGTLSKAKALSLACIAADDKTHRFTTSNTHEICLSRFQIYYSL